MLQQIGSALLAGFLIVLQFVTGVLGYLDGVPGSGSRPVAPPENITPAQSVMLRVATYNVKNCVDGTAVEEIAQDINTNSLDIVAYRSWIAAARGRAAKICCVCSRRKHCRTTAFSRRLACLVMNMGSAF